MTWAEHVAAIEAGKKGFPIVQVCWMDAVSVAPDWEAEVKSDLRRTTTVGYLVDETEEALVIMSLINEEHVGHGIVIPKATISLRSVCKVK